MAKVTNKYPVWHPFSQMFGVESIPTVVKAEGVWLHTEDGKKLYDAISSWWVNLHGHSNPKIAEAVYKQMLNLEHVIFAGFTHQPAIELCERLDKYLPKRDWKYFFSDNGSTAVEVALKMAIQYMRQGDLKRKVNVVALDGSYHGDTFGAMSAATRSVFTDPWDDLFFDVTIIPPPSPGNELACFNQLKEVADESTILIYEPLVLGAAGMVMYSPEAMEEMLSIVHHAGGMLIADEVMTGFGRTGQWFASNATKILPDLMCLSKGLTGGALPMALTICKQELYDSFLHPEFEKGFLHGHSFTGNPVGCAAALASLDLMEDPETWRQIEAMNSFFMAQKAVLEQHEMVKDVRVCGGIIALDIEEENKGYIHPLRNKMYDAFLEKGVLIRPLGNVVYLLPPYTSSKEELSLAMDAIKEVLNELMEVVS
ncbi:MAG: adenosylmethionine--8-amino-7-oxononanoate transaminase [Flavobacteriales bacterium]|nr:adenosylmethionine--8-amino-7-oxononanoate transaminase [Flavobacteriales bacterium]MDG1780347.1 adenosylmethionine--8-amino-7-oxononanoate transaminase [Flavobacteriales bacterium]MDG2246543.1 adenosylmethionine--8-amino-7-oxononanoate transaminase [Flavobacteriales bacterium]